MPALAAAVIPLNLGRISKNPYFAGVSAASSIPKANLFAADVTASLFVFPSLKAWVYAALGPCLVPWSA